MAFDSFDVAKWLDDKIEKEAEKKQESIEEVVKRLLEDGDQYWSRILNRYLINKKRIAQRGYVKEHDLPLFSPRSGHCYFCGEQIYKRISLERAGSDLIIHCPHCKGCYCD